MHLILALILIFSFVSLPVKDVNAFCDDAYALIDSMFKKENSVTPGFLKNFLYPLFAFAAECPSVAAPTKPTDERTMNPGNDPICALDDINDITLGKGEILRFTNNCAKDQSVTYVWDDSLLNRISFIVKAGGHKDWQCPKKGKLEFSLFGASVVLNATCDW